MKTTDFKCLHLLHPDEGSLDHVVPRSRGGVDSWENLVWSSKDVNQRNAHGVAEWKLFLNE